MSKVDKIEPSTTKSADSCNKTPSIVTLGRRFIYLLVGVGGLVLLIVYMKSFFVPGLYTQTEEAITKRAVKSEHNKESEQLLTDLAEQSFTPVPSNNAIPPHLLPSLAQRGYTPAFHSFNKVNFLDLQQNRAKRVEQGMKQFLRLPALPGQETMGKEVSVLQQKGGMGDIRVVSNAGGGNCLFLCYQQMLKSVGVKTDVTALRGKVASSVTPDKFDFLHSIYSAAITARDESIIGDYGFMKGVSDIDQLRAAMMTRAYYGDETALEALDAAYDINTLVLQMPQNGSIRLARRYNDGAVKRSSHYAMLLLDESMVHYELVLYRGVSLMNRTELPMKIRLLLDKQESEYEAKLELLRIEEVKTRRKKRKAARHSRSPSRSLNG